MEDVTLYLMLEVRNIEKQENSYWNIEVKDMITKNTSTVSAKFVFSWRWWGILITAGKI